MSKDEHRSFRVSLLSVGPDPQHNRFKNLLIWVQTSVMYLTCSQRCPSALPTLNLRLTDTCSRLLMRLMAGGKQRDEAQKISWDHLKSGPLESPSGQQENNVLGMNVKALQTRTVWANFVQTLHNVKDHIALMKSCNKLRKHLSRIEVKV